MNPIRKQRLVGIMIILTGVALAVGIALYALRQNIQLFYTPTELLQTQAPTTASMRLGGVVEKDSLERQEGLKVSFWVTDTQKRVKVEFEGILPDLFREGQGIVASGKLNSQGTFVADQVLAKHDENYMPPNLAIPKTVGSTKIL